MVRLSGRSEEDLVEQLIWRTIGPRPQDSHRRSAVLRWAGIPGPYATTQQIADEHQVSRQIVSRWVTAALTAAPDVALTPGQLAVLTVGPSLIVKWRDWLMPVEQPFVVPRPAARSLGLSEDRARLTAELRDSFLLYVRRTCQGTPSVELSTDLGEAARDQRRRHPYNVAMDIPIVLPSGEEILGANPIVVIGPNGSGKTRHTRSVTSPTGLEIQFINALRNTRVAPELQATGVDAARSNYASQKAQSRANHWEMASDFDWMLSQLLAQASGVALNFLNAYEANPGANHEAPKTTLTEIQKIWTRIFPGRTLMFPDWKPSVKSTTSGTEIIYSGNYMSDGEKAALYLIAQIQLANSGIVVIDEPETHFHSLLAVRLWDVLQESRTDIRFVYITHDLTFALSRHNATFVLAHPVQGLKTIQLDNTLPGDVAEALLGSASLSFYASRVVFCEGDDGSYDAALYGAWFNGPDTVRVIHNAVAF